MNHFKFLFFIAIIFIAELVSCQTSDSSASIIWGNNVYQGAQIENNEDSTDFCNFFNLLNPLIDTLHFDFDGLDDYGPVVLSNIELAQVYCEIKRGNIKGFTILCHHYFYAYSPCVPKAELDKLICITDYLLRNYAYYKGGLDCGNCIFDYLKYNPDNNYYVDVMIKYFETYYEHTHSESVAKILCDIYNGDYVFHSKDSIKFKYYDNLLSNSSL